MGFQRCNFHLNFVSLLFIVFASSVLVFKLPLGKLLLAELFCQLLPGFIPALDCGVVGALQFGHLSVDVTYYVVPITKLSICKKEILVIEMCNQLMLLKAL